MMNRQINTSNLRFLMFALVLTFGQHLQLFAQADSLINRFNTEAEAVTYQNNRCYNYFLQEGIKNFEAREYELAVRQFRAAGVCLENSRAESFQADRFLEIAVQMREAQTIDSLNQELVRIRGQRQDQQEWEELLASLDELANRNKDDFPFPEKAAVTLAGEDLRRLIRMRSDELLAGRRTSSPQEIALARARQLATRANLEILRRNPELAMELALDARRIIDSLQLEDALVQQTFGNAVFARHARPITSLAAPVIDASFSADSRYLIARGRDQSVRIWNSSKPDDSPILIGNGSFVHAAEFSSDEDELITAFADNTAALWDRQGNSLDTLRDHRDQVLSADISKDGTYLLTGSRDSIVRLWDSQGQLIRSIPFGAPVYSVTFTPSASRILAVAPGKVEIWDMDGNPLGWKTMENALFYAAIFDPDDEGRVLGSSSDGKLQYWQVPETPAALLPGPVLSEGMLIPSLQSAGGNHILAASPESISLYRSGKLRFTAHCDSKPTTMDFAGRDGSPLLLFATRAGTVELWDIDQKSQLLDLDLAPAFATAVALAPDGKHFLVAISENTVVLCPNPETLYEELK